MTALLRALAMAVALTVVAVACSPSAQSASTTSRPTSTTATEPTTSTSTTATAPTTSTSTTATAPTTSTSTSTTAPTTATTATIPRRTTTTPESRELAEGEIRDIHTRFMTELSVLDPRAENRDAHHRLAHELTTGAQLARMVGRSGQRLDVGESIVGLGYRSNIVRVEIDGETATVFDCSQDTSVLLSRTGDVLTPADDFYKFRGTQFVRVDGVWKIQDFFTGGDNRCFPVDYQ